MNPQPAPLAEPAQAKSDQGAGSGTMSAPLSATGPLPEAGVKESSGGNLIIAPGSAAPGVAGSEGSQGPAPAPASGGSTGVAGGLNQKPLPGSIEAQTRIPERKNPPTSLSPDLQRSVEEVARKQTSEENDYIRRLSQPSTPSMNVIGVEKTPTQVDISRAPSPSEARPIRAIPVPEDWVPLARREWSPSRKYWAAAATCHMPLYFQDPMLERYGHSVETYFGPTGRYLTYPVDDPKQSTQRNQIIQTPFSIGRFAFQILTWPYALIVDPPWEAQYDLGYWRPGDRIPTDLYYQPLTGTGPPLRGRSY
ncbi:MAG: hypothetical protein ACP5XB_15230 [Isosphaeraceae bacterium]